MRSLNRCDGPTRVFVIAGETTSATARELTSGLAADIETEISGSSLEACKTLRCKQFDLIIVDLDMCREPQGGVESAVSKVSKLAQGALVVALSGGIAVSDAMAAMRAGAHDHVSKPINGRAFAARIGELAERHGRPGAVRLTPQQAQIAGSFHGFVGASPQMRVVIEQIERIAPSNAPVFITGESGTGKNLCAEALHAAGPRADQPLIAINCGAVTRDMMETELFGVAQNAYTGALEEQIGAVQRADGGTLFLDDIDALDLSVQTRLMRLLQTQSFSRNGEAEMRTANVRIVAATRANPIQLMSSRRLREDLFYRLHVLPIHMPPLRQRPVDIVPLARHFLEHANAESGKNLEGFSAEAETMLTAHELPGNARQLQNLVKRLTVLFDGGLVSTHMVRAADVETIETNKLPVQSEPDVRPILPMWRQEQKIIEDTITHFSGNISQAAAALEISPSTIYRKRQTWAEMEGIQAEVA